MSKRAILAATAMVAASFNPVLTTSAWAAVTFPDGIPAATGPNSTTEAAMEAQCDALADAHTGNWSGELDQGSIVATYVSGPTEVGSHSIDDAIGDPVGAGTFTPTSVSVLGNPYRIGGSVNMFGVLQSVGGSYSASEYDFLGDFETVYSYAFNCTMTETVQTPVQGYYVVSPDAQGNEEANQNSCDAFTANGPTWPHWGQNHAQCDFVVTQEAGEDEEERPDEAGTPIQETQTDELLAHEDEGEGFSIEDTVLIGQAVICISPKKPTPGGTWQTHNGYTGPHCNTTYFNSAPWGAGSQDSNGTYVSVPVV